MLGSLLLRHQGRGAWRRFNAALAERRFPGKEVADGLLIAIGGTLLLTPGFVTDIFGAILLIPPTRAIVRRLMRGYVGRRFLVMGVPGAAGPRRPDGPGNRRAATTTTTRRPKRSTPTTRGCRAELAWHSTGSPGFVHRVRTQATP